MIPVDAVGAGVVTIVGSEVWEITEGSIIPKLSARPELIGEPAAPPVIGTAV